MKRVITLLSTICLSCAIHPLAIAYPEYGNKEINTAPSLITREPNSAGIILFSMPEPNSSKDTVTDDFLLFKEIFQELKQNYVEEISDQELIKNAITGMLSNLDPHSKYYTPEEFQRIKHQTSGSFAGIGIETGLNSEKDGLIVYKIFKNTPAASANLNVDDLIIKIDGQNVSELDPKMAVNALRGEINTPVNLEIIREGNVLPLTIIRGNIKTPSLSTAALYNNEFAYIRLDHFQTDSHLEIVDALQELEIESRVNQATIQGVILDLRDNNGGLLDASVEVADLFMNGGLITYTIGQSERHQRRFIAQEGDIIHDIPLVILINSQTSSGAEIVAGALQDHNRAVIMGETSYGKGSVQYAVGLKNGQAIRYTVSRYYTPNGRSIQNQGITPDIIIPNIKAKITASTNSLKNREINNHGRLDNPNQSLAIARQPADFADMIEQDYPLYEALNVLRAMSAFAPINSQNLMMDESSPTIIPSDQ